MANPVVVISAGIVLLGIAAPKPELILTYEAYARLEDQGPVTLEYAAGEGRLLMVGISHTLHS